MRPKVVVDTNVWIHDLFFGDPDAAMLTDLIRQEQVTLLVSSSIIKEAADVFYELSIEAGRGSGEAFVAKKLMRDFLNRGRRLKAPPVFSSCEDSSDNKFFDCAIDGKADFVVTRDGHVNGVQDLDITVVSPWQLLHIQHPELRPKSAGGLRRLINRALAGLMGNRPD
jgi:uncharacterized protein